MLGTHAYKLGNGVTLPTIRCAVSFEKRCFVEGSEDRRPSRGGAFGGSRWCRTHIVSGILRRMERGRAFGRRDNRIPQPHRHSPGYRRSELNRTSREEYDISMSALSPQDASILAMAAEH